MVTKIKELNVPFPEEQSPELAKLMARQLELNSRLDAINAEQRVLHSEASAQNPADARRERISAMIDGLRYETPSSVQEKMEKLAAERRDIGEAVRELSTLIDAERTKVCRDIASKFIGLYKDIAAEFYVGLLAVANAHTKIGELHRALRRRGVAPFSLVDIGDDFFGDPLDRNNDAWIALRRAAREGLIKDEDIQEQFR